MFDGDPRYWSFEPTLPKAEYILEEPAQYASAMFDGDPRYLSFEPTLPKAGYILEEPAQCASAMFDGDPRYRPFDPTIPKAEYISSELAHDVKLTTVEMWKKGNSESRLAQYEQLRLTFKHKWRMAQYEQLRSAFRQPQPMLTTTSATGVGAQHCGVSETPSSTSAPGVEAQQCEDIKTPTTVSATGVGAQPCEDTETPMSTSATGVEAQQCEEEKTPTSTSATGVEAQLCEVSKTPSPVPGQPEQGLSTTSATGVGAQHCGVAKTPYTSRGMLVVVTSTSLPSAHTSHCLSYVLNIIDRAQVYPVEVASQSSTNWHPTPGVSQAKAKCLDSSSTEKCTQVVEQGEDGEENFNQTASINDYAVWSRPEEDAAMKGPHELPPTLYNAAFNVDVTKFMGT
ncbi:MAG: hypothetical protein Q9219_000928 [cf. Caloplaca sp. 3 TL-2023]